MPLHFAPVVPKAVLLSINNFNTSSSEFSQSNGLLPKYLEKRKKATGHFNVFVLFLFLFFFLRDENQ